VQSPPSATLTAGVPSHHPTSKGETEARRRRISYFMLFRLGMLAVFTVVAVVLAYTDTRAAKALTTGFAWMTLVVGFVLTILFARRLPHTDDLQRFVWLQTATDIVLAAVVVQMSGGADSGFHWLFLIAVLGAATMGGPRMTWTAAGACVLILVVLGALQWTGTVEPTMLGEPIPPLPPLVLWGAVGRTTAALFGVTFLSAYLGRQLSSTVTEVGELRVLNENIVRSLASGLLTLDTDGRLLYFNPAAEHLLRLTPDAVGTHVEQTLPGLSDAWPAAELDSRIELSVEASDAETLHLGLSRVPLRDGTGERVGDLINFTDLTQIQNLTEQVRRNERLAALGGLAASVAHEIRNPLTAIAGCAELLGSTPDLDAQDTKLLRVILRESTRLSDLIADLLAFTRPKKPQRVRLSLANAVRDTREAFTADPMNKGLDVDLRVGTDVPIMADPAQLSQVIWNLVRNAGEAMDRNGSIEIDIDQDGERCRLAIADHGPGIPADRIERIFDPFFTTKEHGSGFGLAIVHRVVEDNGGTIEVHSVVGEGATFVLRFPSAEHSAEHSDTFSVPLITDSKM